MIHSHHGLPWRAGVTAIIITAVAALGTSSPANAQAKAPSPAQSSATHSAPAGDTATKPVRKSRFGRFGRAFEKAASATGAAAERAGVNRETAARLAITAATGGAGAALMSARTQAIATAPAAIASRSLASPHVAPPAAAGTPANAGTSPEAVRALTELGNVSVRAQQHDPAAMHALQVLSATMAEPNGEFAALERRAQTGDAAAAQQIVIREAAIVHAALLGKVP